MAKKIDDYPVVPATYERDRAGNHRWKKRGESRYFDCRRCGVFVYDMRSPARKRLPPTIPGVVAPCRGMKQQAGRPVGWRKKEAFRKTMMIRISMSAADWLARAARRDDVSRSEVVRRLIVNQMEGRRSK